MADYRIDPDMQVLLAEQTAATTYPLIRLEVPLDLHRAVSNALSMRLAEGRPEMAESADR